MGKRSELSQTVAELKRCGEALIFVSKALANALGANNETATTEPPVTKSPAPEEKPVSLETVRAVLAEKSCDGHTAEIRALLQKHGAVKLSEVAPAKYPVLLAEAEALGNG